MGPDASNMVRIDGTPRYNVTSNATVYLDVKTRIRNVMTDRCNITDYSVRRIETDTGALLSQGEID